MKREKITTRGNMEESRAADDTTDSGTVQMKRGVGLVRGVSLIIGSIIGSGIFISPKGILVGANSVGMSLVVWLICAVISSIAAMCFAELGAVFPQSGGIYQYILHAYGDLPGFMVAWSMVIILHPASLAMVSIIFGTYVVDYVIPGDCPPPVEAVMLFAILAVLISVFINCASVRLSSGMSVVFTAGKVIALVVIIVSGLVKLSQGGTHYLDPAVSFKGSNTQIFGYGIALYNGFWAYGGWETLNNLPEEMKNPARNIPLAIAISIPTVTVIYLLTNIAYFTTLSPDELLASGAVAVTFAERNLGSMAWLVPLGVCISTFGSQLAGVLSTPRLTFAAAREGHMLHVLSMVSVTRLTPLPAVVFQGALAIIFILLGDFNSILIFSGFITWIFYGAAFMSVLVLRRKFPNHYRPFKVPSLVPVLATLVAVFMILAPLISDPSLEYLYALVMLGLGLCVYAVFIWRKHQFPFMDRVTLFFQKLFLLSPSRKFSVEAIHVSDQTVTTWNDF